MVLAAGVHTSESAAYLVDYNTIKARVDVLVAGTGGSDETSAKQTLLNAVVANTTNAQTAVADQRARVEALVTAKATQDQEVAAWGERVTAANTAKLAADTAEDDADAELATIKEQVSKRSWLFTVLGTIDSSQWDTACESGSNAKCAMTESAKTTNTSTWTWNTNDRCNYTQGVGGGASQHTCQMLGLKGSSTGLIQSATAQLGLSRAANSNTATGLYAALDTADYTYSAATSKETDALTQFETW